MLSEATLQVTTGRPAVVVSNETSGGGKTTITNLIARFFDATGGRVLNTGEDLNESRLA